MARSKPRSLGPRRLRWGMNQGPLQSALCRGQIKGWEEERVIPPKCGGNIRPDVKNPGPVSPPHRAPAKRALSSLGAFPLPVPSARKALPWVFVQLSPHHHSVSIPISLESLHPHPTTLPYLYYLLRTNGVHLFTCLSQSLQSSVSKTRVQR